jgi:very-short-patch-repair endonuclease
MSIKQLYNPELVKFAKALRKSSTPAERKLWSYLRSKRFEGYKFKRQQPFLNFIIDFYCPELHLGIEIDGSSHTDLKHDHDLQRQKDLESLGISFLRFTEYQVKNDIISVLQTIENYINGVYSTSP